MLKDKNKSPADDNRQYFYNDEFYIRAEFPIIHNWIKEGSRIIDLGCGNGSLMKFIKENKNAETEGIEISESGVLAAINNGLKVKQGRIDNVDSYKEYANNQFDYAICNVTVQMVMFPEILIREMKRIARCQIISFPNFAFISNRFDLVFFGRMPKPMLFGYNWYDTGHIHQLSVKDFKMFCRRQNLIISKQSYLGLGFFGKIVNIFVPNLFSKVAIFLCQKK